MSRPLALTFDNLGEAADLERRTWPADRPLGRHPSVTVALPRLLDELDALRLRAAFCLEALNCELYPEAIREIAARGHELGLHGFRHEPWSELSAEREDELLGRGRAAFAALGLDVRGFRPPGGDLTARSANLLAAHGFAWCSPAGARPAMLGEVACVPFHWALVDAYYVLASFAPRRTAGGDPPDPLPPDEAARRLLDRLDGVQAPALILHPFLMLEADGWAAARRVLGRVGELAASGAARVAPAGDIAATLRARTLGS